LELLPCMAWIDERHLPPLGLSNAWGYNTIGWCAPDPRLAPGGWDEVAKATMALAKAGIETILDVVYNHSGESDELGPTISLRGLDNAAYYRLQADNPALYVNDAGCGDILRAEHPAVVRLVLDSLRLWAQAGGMAGFRFDLAPTLGRYAEGFDPAHPLLTAIRQDPVLRELKLIAEPWDIGPGGFQLGNFPAVWAEWNSIYRDDLRQFWRGDGGKTGVIATRLAGSQDIFAGKTLPSRSVNFITCHDGFTLADLTAYAWKHNEANGEQNRDGTNDNNSWNHGVEGCADDPAIELARRADQRSLLSLLLASRGTPMLAMGAETGQSQAGNNNAYAQDNSLFWMDWQEADHDLAAFTAALVALRKRHPALHADRFLNGQAFDESLLPDVAWLNADGQPMSERDWNHGRFLAAILAAPDGHETDRVAVIVNRDERAESVTLPPARDGYGWRLETASQSGRHDPFLLEEDDLEIGPRSVVLCAEVKRSDRAPRGLSTPTLERLAQAVGIENAWTDLDGGRHDVPPDTLRTCIEAMGLSAASEGAARESLTMVAHRRHHRALPSAQIGAAGAPGQIALSVRPGIEPRGGLVVEDQSGRTVETPIVPLGRSDGLGEDGRPFEARLCALPTLDMGRYRVWRTDAPDETCQLTIAPETCWTPDPLGRRFGLGAQLYSLRRDGDQGIGDLTTLALLAERAAAAGAACVGVNPLHMLFPQSRERASPYHPSDRRFLDPIHIDVAGLGGPPQSGMAQSGGRFIDYPAVWAAKSATLAAAYPNIDNAGLDAFIQTGGEALRRFCLFQAIAETQGASGWPDWPTNLRHPGSDDAQAFAANHADRLRYHAWLQMLADRQLAEAAARGRVKGLTLGLYGDLALAGAFDGAEVWGDPDLVCAGVSIGAPPDPFSPQGQVWNLPPPNPVEREARGGADFGELLASTMKHMGMIRIDHVLGLARLFWVPDGASALDGAYVAQPQAMLLAQLALESRRHQCLVVGEDLGLAKPGLREDMAARRVLSYKVIHFEREGRGFAPPEHYPELAVACVSTHDLPTFEGWKTGADIAEREAIGEATPAQTEAAAADRAGDVEAMKSALGGTLDVVAAHGYIARSPAAMVLAQLDDLAGETVGVNLPGTDRERPNWRRRLEPPIETLLEAEPAADILAELRRQRP
ncbi:MAG: glycogen debranching enzyme GlgX, partial [Caulobacteraceae bacterium]|nr:glycogen debranching enzyme GlgX [Caulobacteraceae bacterium]